MKILHLNTRSLEFLLVALLLAGCAGTPKAPPAPVLSPAQQRISDWNRLQQEQRDAPTEQKLDQVNRFFNRLNFVDDSIIWGQEDYWATPLEMLERNGGDCEDFTIAKYFTLRNLQLPESTLQLTYVKSLTLNQPHMVLSYYPDPQADPLVLDNLIDGILPASQRSDLVPVYGFNGSGLWLGKQRGQGQRVGDADRLSLWQGLLQRMQTESQTPVP